MIKKYFNLEEKYYKSEKEHIIYYYLKEIIRYLKECEVMEVLSDHIAAFNLKFYHISEFIAKSNRMRPHRPLFSYEGDEFSSCSVIVRVSVVLKRTVGDSD